MSAIHDLTLPFLPDHCYHIFNRGINKQDLFYHKKNYTYFLNKYFDYMQGFVKTYAYCLMDNHFHFFIGVLSVEEILARCRKLNLLPDRDDSADHGQTRFPKLQTSQILQKFRNPFSKPHPEKRSELPDDLQLCAWAVSERWRRLMLGYAKAINSQENRTGSLFQRGPRRKMVSGLEDKKTLLAYILHNPIHHRICKTYEEYNWSSYHGLVSNHGLDIDQQEVASWFESRETMMEYFNDYGKRQALFHSLSME